MNYSELLSTGYEFTDIQPFNDYRHYLKKDGKILLSTWSINQPSKTRRTFNNYVSNNFSTRFFL